MFHLLFLENVYLYILKKNHNHLPGMNIITIKEQHSGIISSLWSILDSNCLNVYGINNKSFGFFKEKAHLLKIEWRIFNEMSK